MGPLEPSSYRQVRVGQFTVGLIGLDEIFTQLSAEGFEPGAAVRCELLARARRRNYIPPLSEDLYAAALLREFRDFCQRQDAGRMDATDHGSWRGHPREKIPWYPTLNASRCDGCGACIRFCPKGVFSTAEEGVVQVVAPYRCQVGCSACVRICQLGAISFPPQEILEVFRHR